MFTIDYTIQWKDELMELPAVVTVAKNEFEAKVHGNSSDAKWDIEFYDFETMTRWVSMFNLWDKAQMLSTHMPFLNQTVTICVELDED